MTTREISGVALYEFLIMDGHRIPTALRNNPGNIQSAVQRMQVVTKCTRKNDKGKDIDDVVSVTYDGHVCPDVKSPKRIFAFARDSNGDPKTAEEVRAIVEHLKSVDWYSAKKPAASTPSDKRRLGRLVFESYNGMDTNDGIDASNASEEDVLAKNAVKAGKINKRLNLPCVFDQDGAVVGGDSMKTLAADEVAIYNADPIKLRNLVRVT